MVARAVVGDPELDDQEAGLMTMRMRLPDAQTRAAMLATGMERGMEASYARLDRRFARVAIES
jgi:hypothetical protein